MSRKGIWIGLGTTLAAASIVLVGLYQTRTYLICASPNAIEAELNGRRQTLSTHGGTGCFVFRGFYGTHMLSMRFPGDRQVRLQLMPRLTDDNSSSLTVTPNSVVTHGDLRFTILK